VVVFATVHGNPHGWVVAPKTGHTALLLLLFDGQAVQEVACAALNVPEVVEVPPPITPDWQDSQASEVDQLPENVPAAHATHA